LKKTVAREFNSVFQKMQLGGLYGDAQIPATDNGRAKVWRLCAGNHLNWCGGMKKGSRN
jgi:hypothetical protein